MEKSTMEKRCFLCLNVEYICVNDEEICFKIEKYLDVKAIDSGVIYLCAYCIESIERFHEFYERVKCIHNIISNNETKNNNNVHLVLPKEESDDYEISHIEEDDECEQSGEAVVISNPELKRKKIKKRKKHTGFTRNVSKRKHFRNNEIERQLTSFFNNVVCMLCDDGNSYPNLKTLDEHFKDNHEEETFLKCCNKIFKLSDKYRLRRHMLIHTNPDSCRCDICGKILSSPRHMRIHKELHIPEHERVYECEKCGRKCGGNAELYRHMKSIHTPQDIVCDICGKKFRRRVTFRVHMKTAHGNNKIFVCEICAKTYKAFASLQQHKQTAHSTTYLPKTKQCSDCGKWMGAVYLKKHMLRVHNDATPYECPLCAKVFKLMSDVRSHMISHSESRPFPCSLCGTAFKTKSTLRTHMGQHTGGKQVQCPYCGKMISNSANYLAHRRRMHTDEYEQDKLASESRNAASDTEDNYADSQVIGQVTEVVCEETVVAEDFYSNNESS